MYINRCGFLYRAAGYRGMAEGIVVGREHPCPTLFFSDGECVPPHSQPQKAIRGIRAAAFDSQRDRWEIISQPPCILLVCDCRDIPLEYPLACGGRAVDCSVHYDSCYTRALRRPLYQRCGGRRPLRDSGRIFRLSCAVNNEAITFACWASRRNIL